MIQPLPHSQWPPPPDRASLEQQVRGFSDHDARLILRDWLKRNAYPAEAQDYLRGDTTGDALSKVSTPDLVRMIYGEIPAVSVRPVPGATHHTAPPLQRFPPFTSEAQTPPDDLSFFAVMDEAQLIQWMVDNLWSGNQDVLNAMPIDKPWTVEEIMAVLGDHYGWT